jgi:hypothetical protein
VQLRFATGLTSEEYVKQKAWQDASLERCPLHPSGGCGFARHSAYERVEPPGAFIARYYCPKGHATFSLLPDCLAARLSSTLAEVEAVAAAVERSSESREVVAARLRPDVQLQGALRWMRRRVAAVAVALVTLKGLRPDLFAGRQPTLQDFRAALGVAQVLPCARELAQAQVSALPAPVGLGHRRPARVNTGPPPQQEPGADPPPGAN